MSDYQGKTEIVRSGDALSETGMKFSRRKFIRNAAVGAAGAAFALGGAESVLAGKNETGEITLDALLLTYFGAHLGTVSSSRYFIGKNYAITIQLKSLQNSDLRLTADIPAGREEVCPIGFQNKSTLVKRALTLRQSFNCGALTSAGAGGPGIPEHTFFSGYIRPRLKLKGNSRKLKFRLVDAEGTFGYAALAFQLNDPFVRSRFSQDTIDSFLSQYVTDPAALVEPRYHLARIIPAQAGARGVITVSESGDSPFAEPVTSTVTAKIVEQSGFKSDVVKQAFQVGNNIEITYSSAQEFPDSEIIRLETELERASPGVNKIYWDRVFKTFVIIDAGS